MPISLTAAGLAAHDAIVEGAQERNRRRSAHDGRRRDARDREEFALIDIRTHWSVSKSRSKSLSISDIAHAPLSVAQSHAVVGQAA